MLKHIENESFGVELTKNFVQSLIGAAVSAAGMIAGFAVLGAVLDRRKPVFLKRNEKVVTIEENDE